MQSAQPLQLGLQVQHRPVRLDRDGCVSTTAASTRSNCSKTASNCPPSAASALPTSPNALACDADVPQAVEEEAVGQFVVGLDLAAEEVQKAAASSGGPAGVGARSSRDRFG